ncbi:phage repressor protein, Serine peptidase, MEROPS family S24 [Magnetococcus marinus MC-1]|uniref:Phage repressor protein, Serine peptidase, MEROPS family S24 n=1 Tax=Magnetococcus marinus (strain ATCC BAA-1437 / JCM 17883 / MC-1) TaxID=156889 RepID=A0LDJ2_MAGMM|nr:XRE family transcriptional regulator [Magnetococcus marinus]ABK46035.1 phage repressor protein, Serine peptidase, MEROPS family S24 [Magnetococcus marinus MC-1]
MKKDLHGESDYSSLADPSKTVGEFNTLGERLRMALDHVGMSQSELARRVGIRPQTVQHVCAGHTRRSGYTAEFAQVLGVRPEWLAIGHGSLREFANEQNSGAVRRLPMLNWSNVIHWSQSGYQAQQMGEVYDLVEVTKPFGNHAFALKVGGDSMEPKVPEGSTILVDPAYVAQNNYLVIAHLEGEPEATFKQLVLEGGGRYLKPLNPRYPIVDLSRYRYTLLGVVRQVVIDLDPL